MSSLTGVSSIDAANMGRPRAIFGHKKRIKSIHELNPSNKLESKVIEQACSVAVLVQLKKREFSGFQIIGPNENCSMENTIRVETLAEAVKEEFNCDYGRREPFPHELAFGFGTAFLIDSRHALTAGHCVCKEKSNVLRDNVTKTALVFGFFGRRQGKYNFQKDDIYRVVKVVAWCNGSTDWAIVRLDREVVGRDPLPIRFNKKMHKGDKVYMLGHPLGVSMKLLNGKVKANQSWCLLANLNALSGVSGGPVFDQKSRKVIGILVSGHFDDFRTVLNQETGEEEVRINRVSDSDIARVGIEGYERIQKLAVPYISSFAANYIFAQLDDAEAQYDLGLAYFRGDGVEQNQRKGKKWLKRAKHVKPSLKKEINALIWEFKAEKALTLGLKGVEEQRKKRQCRTIVATMGLIVIHPLIVLSFFSDINKEEKSRKFEMLSLDDKRFQLFEFLANNEMEKAVVEFKKRKLFFIRIMKTHTFLREFEDSIISAKEIMWNKDAARKHDRYIDFFLARKLIPKKFKQLRFQNIAN